MPWRGGIPPRTQVGIPSIDASASLPKENPMSKKSKQALKGAMALQAILSVTMFINDMNVNMAIVGAISVGAGLTFLKLMKLDRDSKLAKQIALTATVGVPLAAAGIVFLAAVVPGAKMKYVLALIPISIVFLVMVECLKINRHENDVDVRASSPGMSRVLRHFNTNEASLHNRIAWGSSSLGIQGFAALEYVHTIQVLQTGAWLDGLASLTLAVLLHGVGVSFAICRREVLVAWIQGLSVVLASRGLAAWIGHDWWVGGLDLMIALGATMTAYAFKTQDRWPASLSLGFNSLPLIVISVHDFEVSNQLGGFVVALTAASLLVGAGAAAKWKVSTSNFYFSRPDWHAFSRWWTFLIAGGFIALLTAGFLTLTLFLLAQTPSVQDLATGGAALAGVILAWRFFEVAKNLKDIGDSLGNPDSGPVTEPIPLQTLY